MCLLVGPLCIGTLVAGCGAPGAKYGVEAEEAPAAPSEPSSATDEKEPAGSSSSRDLDLWAQQARFTMRLGLQVFARNETVFSVNNSINGDREEIGLDSDLGFDTTAQLGRLDFGWRFGRRHRLGASWFRIQTSASKVIDEEITIGDVVFPGDASVTTGVITNVVKLDCCYSFFQSRRWDASFGVGLHTMLFDASLATSVNDASHSASIDLPAPVQVTGLSASRAFTDRTRLSASADLFAIRFDGAGGTYLDAEVDWSYLGVLFFLRGML